MKQFFQKPFRWALTYSFIMMLTVIYILLDTFVIPQTVIKVILPDSVITAEGNLLPSDSSDDIQPTEPVITDMSYKDQNIQITIEVVRKYDTTFYTADIQIADAAYLKTAFANNVYGRNINKHTSAIAEDQNAIFAINGDYYGFRDYGFVVRNGVLYRSTAADNQALVIDKNGNFSIVNQSPINARTLAGINAWQILSFGPSLISSGKITVDSNSEVKQEMSSNPRTALGQVSALHYIFIVSDGRTKKSAGLSLLELANEFYDRGCTTAYNLDGGGSATMWFNGQVINIPTDGNVFSERSVSDIVYIGY